MARGWGVEPRYSSTLSITSVLDGSGWLTPLYSRERQPEHIVQKAGWPWDRSGRLRKISPTSEFETWTVQPVGNRYIDCDIPATEMAATCKGKLFLMGKWTTKGKNWKCAIISVADLFNFCHPEVFNTYIKYTMMCQSNTTQTFMFFIVLGQHVSILIESSSGSFKKIDPYLEMLKCAVGSQTLTLLIKLRIKCTCRCFLNRLTPNDPYMSRTAPLSSKRCILYIYSTNIGNEYFKHALYSPFFSLQNAVVFHNANLIGSCIIHILYTEFAKIKKIIIPAPKG